MFVDESGDHELDTIDPGYPMFVLAFCVIRKEDYVATLTSALQRFKLKHFGHDDVIMHEREIRKDNSIGDVPRFNFRTPPTPPVPPSSYLFRRVAVRRDVRAVAIFPAMHHGTR